MLDGANTFGLYSMLNGLYFYSSPWSIVSAAKLFWRFGWDVKRLKNTLDTFIASFCQLVHLVFPDFLVCMFLQIDAYVVFYI